MIIAFQGEPGAYSEAAARQCFENGLKTLPCVSFGDVLLAVENNKADYAILPTENSIEGVVGQGLDLLARSPLVIEGETYLHIHHCLIAHPSVSIGEIRKVYSHPQALGQCREFLEQHAWEVIPFYDTAGSVKMVREKNLRDAAGIASKLAADIYGMKPLVEGIETNHQNFTRFFIVGRTPQPLTEADKTSIVFRAVHKPGALLNVLKEFADRGLNLTRLESRPVVGDPWTYSFYIDCEGHQNDPALADCLKAAESNTTFLKVMGSYPKSSPPIFSGDTPGV